MNQLDKIVKKTTEIIADKHARSTFFLIFTAIVIFIINGLLPTIEGKAHYTADPITIFIKSVYNFLFTLWPILWIT